MQHLEFFDNDHFENNYYRVKPVPKLSPFIDFFWETKFDKLLSDNPEGFSDVLFPNIGYTYLINLGTQCIMKLDNEKFDIRLDGLLPRHTTIECYHSKGNCLFGIKFKCAPVLLEKKINFAEYKSNIISLSYLLDQKILIKVKNTPTFQKRVSILTDHFLEMTAKDKDHSSQLRIVSGIINECYHSNNFKISIKELAGKYNISPRTLHRYFEAITSLSTKKAIQIMRIRKAVQQLIKSPLTFDYKQYGYYDNSHFNKHLSQFLKKSMLIKLRPHLKILNVKSSSKKKITGLPEKEPLIFKSN